MATKTLTIKEEIYFKLRQLKREDESFSDLLERLASEVPTIEILKSMAGSIEFDDPDALKREITKKRRESRK